MASFLNRFFKSESGATAIEYALIASIIAIGIITAVKNVGKNMNKSYSNLANAVGNAQ